MPLFAEVPDEDLQKVANFATTEEVPAGATVVKGGAASGVAGVGGAGRSAAPHRAGGQGTPGANRAGPRHCDRVTTSSHDAAARAAVSHWGRHSVPGKARHGSRKPGDLSSGQ